MWLRFGSIHALIRGVTYSKSDVSETPTPDHLPILRANNIGATLTFEDPVFVRKERISPGQMLRQGDYLIALSSGSKNLVGKAAYVESDYAGGFGGFCGVIRVPSKALEPFVGVFLSSRLYRDAISAGSRGIGINNLKRETLSSVPFPLPPLAEQHRIVAKVDELMVLCDRLEAAQAERETRRTRLVASTHAHLAAAKDDNDFRKQAKFIIQNSSLILDSVPRLRQTVLNLAVRGKLLPQDPSDEAPSHLLDRVRQEKVRMQQEVKTNNRQRSQTNDAKAPPFAIPEVWQWALMGT
jgi:type I restriction enzyme S subunit